eukprot:GHVS01000962.1.p1 GENE.GHVS01000962.1~~GHVS01000962.1.p1  ORF type:complete len:271 (-),score=50.88 GHVS01000962.1:384-1196(-)
MGCRHSRNKTTTNAATVSAIDPKGKLLELVEPEPDLGWRRVFNERAEQLAAQHYHHAVGANHRALMSFYMSPSMFNERTSAFCSVHLVTLALNIAVRAARLADLFGISHEEEDTGHRWRVEEEETAVQEEDVLQIYHRLHIPVSNWRLVERLWRPGRSARGRTAGAQAECWWNTRLLSKMKKEEFVVVDVGEIGLNKSEELYRLEKKNNLNSCALPTQTFEWKYMQDLPGGVMQLVRSPDNEAMCIVAEELIMNTATWVQQTYLTQPILT